MIYSTKWLTELFTLYLYCLPYQYVSSSYAFWDHKILHLCNHILCTCMAFLQCERGCASSEFLLGWMSSRTLNSDVASLHCGWEDVGLDLFLWLKKIRTNCIYQARAGPRAESARAFTGRRCPHSGKGEDFLTGQLNFFYGTAVTPDGKSKIVPNVGINRHAEG